MKIRLLKEHEITKGKKLKPGRELEVDRESGNKLIQEKKAEAVSEDINWVLQKDIEEGFAVDPRKKEEPKKEEKKTKKK